MAQVSKDMTIGEVLAMNPEVAPNPYGDWNALSWLPGFSGRKSC